MRFSNFANQKIQWLQVWSLALVQGAIALAWVIYNLYLVSLLTQLGFSAALATALLILENLLAMVMEPLMGSLSDRLQRQLGTRFPLISIGVILSAGLFLGIPLIALGGLSSAFRWVLPLMVVAWALAMTIFRSPAMSLLGRCAFGTRLPLAASILTLVGGVAGAMGPLASEQILAWGPVVAFGIGSGVLLLAMLALRLMLPEGSPDEATPDPNTNAHAAVSWSSLALVFTAGVGITFGFRLLMLLFSKVLDSQIPDANTRWVLGSIFIALAVVAIPAGQLAVRWGNRRAMLVGLAGLTFICVTINIAYNNSSSIVLAILFGAAFSLVSNGTIPFALSMVPSPKAGLGTGMFFSGGAAAASLFGTVAELLRTMPTGLASLLGILALLLAGACITFAPQRIVSIPS
ncbi:MFS transporter [Oscillatoria sp. CS-180]|uniref:MFS transporter n=1 Tax=Oscillatoria sp. CS-180 TaxID=3021720 RepID=UPI00232F87DE|nr:MFS transporter [Oscillatoria sp. CS-180]